MQVQTLNNLVNFLCETNLDPKTEAINVGLKTNNINFNSGLKSIWTFFVKETQNQSSIRINILLNFLITTYKDYPNESIGNAINEIVNGHKKSSSTFLPNRDFNELNYEKIIGSRNSLMPIHFLEKGIQCSKAVVRVITNNSYGTGFILRNNLLLTNNHVIPSLEVAKKTQIQFNYEIGINGSHLISEFYSLLPNITFITSEDLDFSLIKIEGDCNSKYGFLSFSKKSVLENDFVSIIQHPEGKEKQIALYNSLVTDLDEKYIQYTTDTMPGSSGSPVFNANWEVVALHHAGGNMRSLSNNSKQIYVNQGINSNAINKIISHNLG